MTDLAVIEGSVVESPARSLEENEAIVERGLGTFVEVGLALREIRDAGQYKAVGFDRFEDYLEQRWDMGRKRAYDLIGAADKVEAVSPIGDTPATESVARELPTGDPEAARKVWATAVEEHGPKPTAKAVAEVRERIAPKQAKPARPAPTPAPEPAAPKQRPARPSKLPAEAEHWSPEEVQAGLDLINGKAAPIVTTRMGGWVEKYHDLDVWVAAGSAWANPFTAGEDGDADEVVSLYAAHFLPFKRALAVADLRGKALRFNPTVPGGQEHAAYLAALANGEERA